MVQTIQARNATLRDLIDNFGLQLVRDNQFFREWQDNLPAITDSEKQLLDRVVDGFINLLNYPPVLEDVVKSQLTHPDCPSLKQMLDTLRVVCIPKLVAARGWEQREKVGRCLSDTDRQKKYDSQAYSKCSVKQRKDATLTGNLLEHE